MPLLASFLRMNLLSDDVHLSDDLDSHNPLVIKPAEAPADEEQVFLASIAHLLKDERDTMLEKHRAYIEYARRREIADVEWRLDSYLH